MRKLYLSRRSNNHVLDENDPYLYFTKLARFKNELF